MKPLFLLVGSLLTLLSAFGQTPVANFSADRLTGCSPLVVQFTDLSTGNPSQREWDLGLGGPNITVQNPLQVYSTPGTYTIKLIVRNINGADSITKVNYITVAPKPQIDFKVNDSINCFPLNAQFTDLTTVASGSIVSWNWDFGDGSGSAVKNPAHIYRIDNPFNVTLQVTTDIGCTDVLVKKGYMDVKPGVRPSFFNSFASACKPPSQIDFFNNSSGPATLNYQWRFGDGSAISTATNPVHTYNAFGNYPVTLIVSSSDGCTDSTSNFVDIPNVNISSSIQSPDTSCVNQPILFQNISTPPADSSGWKFGDGTELTGQAVQKVYNKPGTYTVKLTNLFTACLDSVVKRIVIIDTAAVNFISSDTGSCKAPYTANFIAQSPNAVEYFWEFGDGGTSSAANPSHTYTSLGNYTVKLTIKNRNGCASTRIKYDFVKIAPPSLRFLNLPDSGCAPLTLQPKVQIIAPDGVDTYFWNFGGSTSTSPTPTVTYNTTGTFPMSLAITTKTGCLQTLSMADAVKIGVAPVANFLGSPTLSCAGDPVNFTDLSTGTITGWRWDFGDPGSPDNISILNNPLHKFSDTGTFTVSLRVFNNGCFKEITKPAYIRTYGAVAKFGYQVNCSNKRQVQFLDSSINAVTRQWNFGDGTTSNAMNPTHTFPALGNYNVSLTVSDGTCTYVLTKFIKIIDEKANYTVSPTTLCRGATIKLTASATDSNVVKYEWDPGTGFLTKGDSVLRVIFDTPRIYKTRLVVTDDNGCTDTVRRDIGVGGPRAKFTAVNATGCVGITVNFKDSSLTDGVNAITSRVWSFGDGSVQNILTPPVSHQYILPGFYNVQLKVTDASGCTDSLLQNSLVVASNPKADFGVPDSVSCPGKSVQFLTRATGAIVTHRWSFGDGKTSGARNPQNIYSNAGLYDIKLFVLDRFGCADSISKPKYVLIDTPFADFKVNDTTANCPPLDAKFQFAGRFKESVRWDFGDGDVSILDSPTHLYGIPGTYIAKLIVRSPGGCTDTAFKTMRVFGPNGTLTYVPSGGCNPIKVDFKVSTKNTDSVFWVFGDNSGYPSKDTFATHTYTTAGTIIPSVVLQDVTGCKVEIKAATPLKVIGIKPGFDANTKLLCDRGAVNFIDTTVTNGNITQWDWDFGDGTTGSGPAPTHFYTTTGFKDVKLKITTEFGCTDSVTIQKFIKIVTSPVTGILSSDTVCQNRFITYRGTVNVPDTSALTWAWNFANGNTSLLQNPPTQQYIVPGSFTVQMIVTNSSGCKDTVLKPITVHPLPNIDAGLDSTICLGQQTPLNATGAATYAWLPPNASLTCVNCPNPTAAPTVTTLYRVRGTNALGCQKDDSVRITVIQPSTVKAPPNDSLCLGQGMQLTASGVQVYSWTPTTGLSNPFAASPIARPTITTTYVVTGSDSRGCFVTKDSVRISVFPVPVFDLGPDVTIPVGSSVNFLPVRSNDITGITWSPVNGLSCTDCPDPVASPKQKTTYTATVTNNGGCVTADQITVFVICTNENIFIPNTFSPNNDGMNDQFFPRGRGLLNVKNLRVFSRWGQMVFSAQNFLANDASAGWDGTFKGAQMPSDVYVYMIDIICENGAVVTLKGDVMLVR